MIVSYSAPVMLLGGASVAPETLKLGLSVTKSVVCADGGADLARAAGIRPLAVIGDMDSISAAARVEFEGVLHEVAEQDSTDFGKCLRSVEAPLLLAVGFLGARVDHTLAALSALVAHRGAPVVMLGDEDVALALPGDITLDLPLGARVSLFPMAGVTGRSTGLEWPIDGIPFTPAGRIGTSNRASGGPVRLQMDGRGMVLLLEPAHLGAVFTALGISHGPQGRPGV